MKPTFKTLRNFALLVLTLPSSIFSSHAIDVQVLRVPDGGIQPQVHVDSHGTLHLIYFKGDSMAGDLFYVRRLKAGVEFSEPLKINAQSGSAIALGTIRGAQLAVDGKDRPHVAWMGSPQTYKSDADEHPNLPMIYTRLNDAGTTFEPERDVKQWTTGLDGGGSLAADQKGRVHVAWHGWAADVEKSESTRAMFVATSENEGMTFGMETAVNPSPTGSCGCCGMLAFVDKHNALQLIYRGATSESRDMILLSEGDGGNAYSLSKLTEWPIQACPMSSSSVVDIGRGLWVATEAEGKIEIQSVLGGSVKSVFSSPPKTKHPRMIANGRGDVLIAWARDAAWGKGGELFYQSFTSTGTPMADEVSVGELPKWSFAAITTNSDGEFVLIY